MVRFTRSRSSPRQAASRLAAIRVLVTLGNDDEDLDCTTTALRFLGVSEAELAAALAGSMGERARAS
jgi:hypothetical protein